MMNKMIILGSGAAPGVPSVACGWGACNPDNPKNRRRRTTVYFKFGTTEILIDTSPDLHDQLIDGHICRLDAVLYTHTHADHLHGIDDLREINRLSGEALNIYAGPVTAEYIKHRFSYVLSNRDMPNNPITMPSLFLNECAMAQSFMVNDVKITPIELQGHILPSNGYIFNDGEVVYIADCTEIPQSSLKLIKKQPKLLIIPLTTLRQHIYHMGLETLLSYVKEINPRQTIINHMAIECDYDEVNRLTPDNVFPAFDNMIIEF